MTKPWRLRRSMMITPGHRRERLEKAATLQADSLAFDLEDGVPPSRKEEARATIAAVLREVHFGRRERAVRINGIGTEDFARDLAALPLDHLDALLVPKVESAAQLQQLDAALAGRDIGIIATLETPRGVLNALAIADASPNLVGMFFGPGDYTLQTGGALTARALEFPRATIAAACGAVGIQAIDAPYLLGLRDVEATHADALAAKELGFSGKVVFHPDQIAPINAAFTPDAAEVEKARRFVAAYAQAAARGEAVALVDGEFIAMDLVPRMERIIALSEEAAAA
ncbi:CoA ester lyase [Roseococcus sp. SDR]|uniref:HpcH/HpaI aldolase/citrate lyase family protein n=1 Tax=Roseococcus sp. SDR TaxID=2835532 RepID=UPI001BD05B26|nr:CoA ester lyase [Roseococcus sp. SDR]MBS7790884.1 CoA ester lyase [Roseococcus sp. SDR]MBV1846198.1 CoA ester lyase [Roseococcus sp. SDR]